MTAAARRYVEAAPVESRLYVSGFRCARSRHPAGARVTWARLCARLTTFAVVPVAKDQRDRHVGCWSPVLYREGATRGLAGVELVSAIVLDHDDGASITDGRAPWNNFAHLLHTSWSHTDDHPRYRIVVPLAEPVSAALWPRVWEWAAEHAGVNVDGACKDASRLYFVPAVPSDDAPREAYVNEGPILDLDASTLPPTAAERLAAAAARRPPIRRWGRSDSNPRLRREIAERLKSDPSMRQRWGELLGGRCDGSAMRDMTCPSCGRPSLWWPLVPTMITRAMCRHRNTCGAS